MPSDIYNKPDSPSQIGKFNLPYIYLKNSVRMICSRSFILFFLVTTIVFLTFYSLLYLLVSPHSFPRYKFQNREYRRGEVVRALEEINREEGKTLGEDSDPEVRKKRDVVKQLFVHAWENYVKYAWGSDELNPLSKSPARGIFGGGFGATIVDSIDTMYLMGLPEHYWKARTWIRDNLSFSKDHFVSLFEFNIRMLGGLLSMYALTDDDMYLKKATDLGDRLLPAFDTSSGVPRAQINLLTKNTAGSPWASGSILAEFGTLHLEFVYLSYVTGNPVYAQKVYRIREQVRKHNNNDGLYPIYYSPDSGFFSGGGYKMGALADSFYEYLLKAWLQADKGDSIAWDMFSDSVKGMKKHLIKKSHSGMTYFGEYGGNSMEHLACFAGGMLALGGQAKATSETDELITLGKEVTSTCHESYIRTPTHLGPEIFSFTDSQEAISSGSDPKYYIMRPEVVESYFVLWRVTGNPMYRDWGWSVVEALIQYCKVDGGVTGLRNVYSSEPERDDVLQSFFMAETLKYLYLLFSSEDFIILDDWVFNTEAHPLPVISNFAAKINITSSS